MNQTVFYEQNPGESLEMFSQRCLKMGRARRRTLNRAVDELVHFLQQNFSGRQSFSVAKVIKAGSLGKGTGVRNSADIDLVVYFNGLDSVYKLKDNREYLLEEIEKDITRWPSLRGRVTGVKKTRFSVQFVLNDVHDVDVLPIFEPEPFIRRLKAKKRRMYRDMADVAKTETQGFMAYQFSASLSFAQIDFVKHADESVKKVIRLVKKWKKEKRLPGLRSYTVELITIHTAVAERKGLSTDELFVRTLEELRDIRDMRVYFTENYDVKKRKDGTAGGPKYVPSFRGPPSKLCGLWRHKTPYVIDVANPFNNLLHDVDTSEISEAASGTLRLLRR